MTIVHKWFDQIIKENLVACTVQNVDDLVQRPMVFGSDSNDIRHKDRVDDKIGAFVPDPT